MYLIVSLFFVHFRRRFLHVRVTPCCVCCWRVYLPKVISIQYIEGAESDCSHIVINDKHERILAARLPLAPPPVSARGHSATVFQVRVFLWPDDRAHHKPYYYLIHHCYALPCTPLYGTAGTQIATPCVFQNIFFHVFTKVA